MTIISGGATAIVAGVAVKVVDAAVAEVAADVANGCSIYCKCLCCPLGFR